MRGVDFLYLGVTRSTRMISQYWKNMEQKKKKLEIHSIIFPKEFKWEMRLSTWSFESIDFSTINNVEFVKRRTSHNLLPDK